MLIKTERALKHYLIIHGDGHFLSVQIVSTSFSKQFLLGLHLLITGTGRHLSVLETYINRNNGIMFSTSINLKLAVKFFNFFSF